MKQVLQDLRIGVTKVVDVPAQSSRPGHLLISTQRSLISAGTERTLVEFGQASLLAKARAQPDRVRQVLDKIRTDGLLPTLEAVFARLDQPLPLGYCNAGVVLEVGQGVTGFSAGDRVISNGPHAEVVCVPQNLCARIPEGVSDDEAAFTVLAAVGLQGIRLAKPTLGENVAVIGLGLVGLMAVQMLVANGCRVLGTDFDPHRLALARQFGAQAVELGTGADPVEAGLAFSERRGMDAVLIAASTKSSDPVRQAAQMSRKRGRIVLVGVTGLELSRADFYEKELTFQVSCSYGPGRYDDRYEQQGHDYPLGYVRWTEQRNFASVLTLMAEKKLVTAPLISERVPQSQAPDAYHTLTQDRSALGIVLTYPQTASNLSHSVHVDSRSSRRTSDPTAPVVGVIGAGNYASRVLIPALAGTAAVLKTVASLGGTSAALAAQRFGFEQATTDYRILLDDPEINTVFVATRHNSHAKLVTEALQAGKHVFVEKPLALTRQELSQVEHALKQAQDRQFMVGYNRRFASLALEMKKLLAPRTHPVNVIYTVNAGRVPPDHWTQDPQIGGGRVIGEGCHFVDFVRYLVGGPIIGADARMLGASRALDVREDKMTLLIEFADGSNGVIHYLANGSQRFPKERVEVFSEGRILVLNNYRTLRGYSWPGFRKKSLMRQDKGHTAEIGGFIKRVQSGGEWLIPWQALQEVSLATFVAMERAAERPRALE